jgi:phenylacetate-CoA ligase
MSSGIYRTLYIMGSRFRGTPVIPFLRGLEESQWWDIDRTREYQLDKLRGLLRHAEEFSPFYRNIFEKNDFKTDIGSLDDLSELPAAGKDEIRANFPEIQNHGLGGSLIPSKTSGSTGEPLKFYRGSEWDAQHRAAVARGYGWYGVFPWSRSGLLWGLPAGRSGLLKTRFEDSLQNRFREKRFDLSHDTLEDFYRRLSSARFLEGYSSMVYELARFINTHHPGDERIHLSLVKGTSEKIYPRYHEASLKAFGRRMTSEYGAAETGIIAFECPEGNMHINMEHVIVEEEDGEIIVTNLLSYSFPFIRYRLGDHISMAGGIECPCGRKSPVISEITGRIGKRIFGTGGSSFPSLTVYYVINALYEEFPGLSRLQARQESEGEIDFLAVYDDEPGSETLAAMEKRLKTLTGKYFGKNIEAKLTSVESIIDKGDKKLDFISHLPQG